MGTRNLDPNYTTHITSMSRHIVSKSLVVYTLWHITSHSPNLFFLHGGSQKKIRFFVCVSSGPASQKYRSQSFDLRSQILDQLNIGQIIYFSQSGGLPKFKQLWPMALTQKETYNFGVLKLFFFLHDYSGLLEKKMKTKFGGSKILFFTWQFRTFSSRTGVSVSACMLFMCLKDILQYSRPKFVE